MTLRAPFVHWVSKSANQNHSKPRINPPSILKPQSPNKQLPAMDTKFSSQNENQREELLRVTNSSSTLNPQFKIPDEWVIEGRSRSNSPGHIDKYYYEPGTGKQFRSLISVQRYLSGETSKKVKRGNEKDMRIVPRVGKSHTLFGLPDGWIVEGIPRKNINYAGKVDKYYVEQETGKRFRSLVAVEKYLAEEEPSRRFRSLKELVSGKKVEDSTPPAKVEDSTPPAKIKWVLNGPRGNVWRAFMDNSLVPESVMQEWSETFISSLND